MIDADDIRARLVSAGICRAGDLQGLTANEIAAMEREAGLAFPGQYVEFLRAAGKSAPGYYDGSIVYGREVLSLGAYFSEELDREPRLLAPEHTSENENAEAPWRPSAKSFVYFGHGAYHFWYFIADGSDDPLVYSYEITKGPQSVGELTLSQWISGSIDNLAEELARLERGS